MNRHYLSALFCIIFLCSSPLVWAQNESTNCFVLLENEEVPEGAKKMGNVKMGDGFRFVCGYDETLKIVEEKAADIGANMLKITDVKEPDLMSTCYRIKAEAYYYEDIAAMYAARKRHEEAKIAKLIPPGANYALLYIYRQKGYSGQVQGYDLNVGDSVYRMNYNTAYTVKVQKEGSLNVWARPETRNEDTINISFGKVYFLRCDMRMALSVSHPSLTLMDFETGYSQFKETHFIDDPSSLRKKSVKNSDRKK